VLALLERGWVVLVSRLNFIDKRMPMLRPAVNETLDRLAAGMGSGP